MLASRAVSGIIRCSGYSQLRETEVGAVYTVIQTIIALKSLFANPPTFRQLFPETLMSIFTQMKYIATFVFTAYFH